MSSHIALFIEAFLGVPRVPNAYRLGGGSYISFFIQDAFQIAEQPGGKSEIYEYRDGSHITEPIFVIGNLSRMRTHFPGQAMNIILNYTITDIFNLLRHRKAEKA